jgi:ABC-2 type transport system permease protein
MFRRILRHDWRTLRADFSVWVTAATFGAALAYGLYNGVRWADLQLETLDAVAREEQGRLSTLQEEANRLEAEGGRVPPFRDPRNPSSLGQSRGARYAILPPSPLAALSIGQSDLFPSFYRMSTDAREVVLGAADLENPQTLLTGRFDLSFVIIYLYPLLILVLSYNLLSGEQEQGTLTLALSQPVALGTLVRAKVLLRGALIVGFALTMCVAGLIAARVPLAVADAVPRLMLWTAAVAAYGGLWFGIAIVIAAFGRSSATNAMLLAGSWLLLVLLIPSVINLVVTTVYPVPSRVRMVQAARDASEKAMSEGSQLLARYYEDHPELAVDKSDKGTTDFTLLRVAVNAEVERRVRPVVDHYDRQLMAQQRSVSWLRYLSPAIVMQDTLNDLAGTGTARHGHFVALIDQYHQEWRAFFLPLIVQKARVTAHESIPRFHFKEERSRDVVARASIDLIALSAPALLLGLLGLRRLRRFPVVG